MCTVTLLPLENKNFILTSNRDEHPNRATISPKKYTENGVDMFFPKDEKAGGTWIGVSKKNRMICVLNGAYKNHVKKKKYLKSRGVIAKEILKSNNFLMYVEELNLKGIEPFTMIIADWNSLENLYYELIWNEETKHLNKLNNKPKIWSSSTLYTDQIKEKRKLWFKNWLETSELSSKEILKFHHLEKGAKEQSILMCRPNCETVSITQVKKESLKVEIIYEDVIHKKTTTIQI
ncbi:NRDE family protein [Lutibacter sp. TH_r2]|uniref:NRDE family protein n=1 Tax=Lutibacter sp. TH_r2 TaxID=3082083 RepID=UPI0029557DCC|nr:NRDE family protein [Lutibacter sp. TH_r2]MDV7186899.1 NRDE family protein [Lutibacter sp. TH_r2]